jgi:hypothetical protein
VRTAHPHRALFTASSVARRKRTTPFCAADIFVVNRGPSARTCLRYAVYQTSIEGESEFSRRPIHNENISDKKTKTKSSAAGSPFLVTFLAKQKSD